MFTDLYDSQPCWTIASCRLIKQCVEAFRRAQILCADSGSSAYGGSLLSHKTVLSGVRVVVLVELVLRTVEYVLRASTCAY
eukprot:SAG25_NODE_414_length_8276_cov_29.934939_7_plen_81_part_00